MIGIYVLLLLAMILVIKFCKKALKVVLGIVIVLITIYCVILNIDMNMVKSCREPIFAKENGHMGSMIRYDGLGYKVGLEKNSKGDITDGQLTILDFYLTQVHTQMKMVKKK